MGNVAKRVHMKSHMQHPDLLLSPREGVMTSNFSAVALEISFTDSSKREAERSREKGGQREAENMVCAILHCGLASRCEAIDPSVIHTLSKPSFPDIKANVAKNKEVNSLVDKSI